MEEYKEYPNNKNYIIYRDGRIFSKRYNKFLTPKKNWESTMEIERCLNIKHSNISYACKNSNTHYAGGYYWKYNETSND